MGRTCPHCGSSEIDDDAARGDSTCMNCGTVLEESTIVSDVTFQENSGGGHSLVGQFISKDRGQSCNLPGVSGLVHQESREVTHAKGRKLIEEIASQLRINQHCKDTAFNFFKMCVSRNLTRGRVRSHVVAACLYMTCRLENTAHLLLDFSDITQANLMDIFQVNVFDLGRTLNFLARSLRINLPTTDPCLYILRFAVLLEFGEKQKEVVSLATRLVQRMKRDWIATGRRPTGLCGAALLLAARCCNFNRTIADVVRVVHVSEGVVRKRLDEFGQTPSSSLTIDEFSSVDLEHCEDPPAFQEAKRKLRALQKQKEEEEVKKMEAEVQPLEEKLELALEKKRREKFKRTPYAKMMTSSLTDDANESPELLEAEKIVCNELVDYVFDTAEEDIKPKTGMSSCYAPSLESLGITDPLKPASDVSTPAETYNKAIGDGEDMDFEECMCFGLDIDDDEIDSYILSKEEAELKARFWMKINGEHLAEMERKCVFLRKQKEEELKLHDKETPLKKKRRQSNVVRKKEPIVAATALEAMEKVIAEKNLSKKINYNLLKETLIKSDLSTVEESKNVKVDVKDEEVKNGTKLNPLPKESLEKRLPQLPTRSRMLRKKIVPKLSGAKRESANNSLSEMKAPKISVELFDLKSIG
uniref:B-related factor 1 n=1 Tax=Syphacia muris TaxID=451379 RepID=A0A0N5ALQ2_9BILA